jgi:hypothetical protein
LAKIKPHKSSYDCHTSNLIDTMAYPSLKFHMSSGAELTNGTENTMKNFLKLASAPAAALVAAIAFGAINMPAANAGEFCRTDVTGHMTGCGFDSMAQCQASSSGLGGDCFRDPYLNDSKGAFAYLPKSSRSKHGSPAAGRAANTSQ